MTSRVILIDGDILCYKISQTAETAINWASEGEPDLWTVHADEAETKRRFKSAIYSLKESLGADWAVICITKDTANFRKALLPSYKASRVGMRKPLLTDCLRQFCIDHFGALWDERLEADDILGILATGGEFGRSAGRPRDAAESADIDMWEADEFVIVSSDKDLKTIPGLHHNPEQHFSGQVVRVLQEEADLNFYAQALGGDITDNYAGCPGIGPERAKEWLRAGVKMERYEHTFKSGKRKGQVEERWREVEAANMWEAVVSQFVKAGLTEDDALVQARCARILRSEDYMDGEVKLWQPR